MDLTVNNGSKRQWKLRSNKQLEFMKASDVMPQIRSRRKEHTRFDLGIQTKRSLMVQFES
jgi:hypothetical protein